VPHSLAAHARITYPWERKKKRGERGERRRKSKQAMGYGTRFERKGERERKGKGFSGRIMASVLPLPNLTEGRKKKKKRGRERG